MLCFGLIQQRENNMSEVKTLEQLSAEVIEAIEDKKGLDIITLNVRGRCNFADQFILATGRTDRQLKALAMVCEQLDIAMV